MRDKKRKIERLEQELPKYCDQIGILDHQRPKLVFNIKDYKANGSTLRWGRRSRQRTLGECLLYHKLILVRVSDYQHNRLLRNLITTLIHELVHYRFPSLPHGPKFEKRIEEIRKGMVFPYKEIKGIKSDVNGV